MFSLVLHAVLIVICLVVFQSLSLYHSRDFNSLEKDSYLNLPKKSLLTPPSEARRGYTKS